MVDRNSREESEIYRSIRKTIPSTRTLDNYNGEHVDEIQRRIGYLTCRFCGLPMAPHQDWGGACMWRCFSRACPNNIDDPLKMDVRDLDIRMPNNPQRSWGEWTARRLA